MQYISECFPMRGDLIALEDLRQYTLVMRDGHGLRCIDPEDDITQIETYFVNHVFPIGWDELIIQRGLHVTVAKTSLMFGLIG
ncbi:hypothetical protein [Paenibacillus sp. LPE1-1-1.1]|uniref:hypothetical protein n=1 Tax=Paenibacillus sp. LPE1-1-1.1 TaxID=3135230 RepID=UPI0034189CE2